MDLVNVLGCVKQPVFDDVIGDLNSLEGDDPVKRKKDGLLTLSMTWRRS